MAQYKKLLLAVDFHADNDAIVAKAKEVADSNDSELFLIHVNEPLAIAYATDGLGWSDQIAVLEANMRREGEQKLAALGNNLGCDSDHCLTREGKPADEIHEVVKDLGIDLVVLGTHGQHGLQLLLGSTANSVLHGSTCDVLCVRVGG